MAKPKKTETAATAAAQETQDTPEMSQDTQEIESVSEAAESGQDEAELEEVEFIEYAVTAKGGLRLREEPSQDASVVAVLPCDVGVLGNNLPAENGWRQVFTGRLFGWVMDKFLEPLELPELDDGAE